MLSKEIIVYLRSSTKDSLLDDFDNCQPDEVVYLHLTKYQEYLIGVIKRNIRTWFSRHKDNFPMSMNILFLTAFFTDQVEYNLGLPFMYPLGAFYSVRREDWDRIKPVEDDHEEIDKAFNDLVNHSPWILEYNAGKLMEAVKKTSTYINTMNSTIDTKKRVMEDYKEYEILQDFYI